MSAPMKFISAVEWNWNIGEKEASVRDSMSSIVIFSRRNLWTFRIWEDE